MKKIRLMSMALACLVAVSAFGYTGENMKKNSKVTAEESTDNWVLTWSDEFEGDTLDMTKWTYDIGNWKLDEKGNYETSGWGNSATLSSGPNIYLSPQGLAKTSSLS